METKYLISFCTVSMNRLHHLKHTLERNILANLSYSNLEYILLDYNSSDGTKTWVMNNMKKYLKSGILKYYHNAQPIQFDRSHSRNMAFRLATGDLLCNVDADNFLGVNFAQFINQNFQHNNEIFLTPQFYYRDVIGRLVIKATDFKKSRGYHESMSGYGFEDIELYRRLSIRKLKHVRFFNKAFLEVIHHSNQERFANEHIGQNCKDIYLRYIQPDKTEVLYFYIDGTFEMGCFLDNEEKKQTELQNEFDNKISLEREWTKGYWKQLLNGIALKIGAEKNKNFHNYKNKGGFYHSASNKRYFKVGNIELQNHLKLLKSEMENRSRLKQFLTQPMDHVNVDGYGKGVVTLNFIETIYLK
ncbi:glycosyltransferase family A protein [Pedobacter jejuensis]|uniref:Glycosyltransferase family 2 protein n=1 Tax=Pedobacter jejuensis TaxID=1268550 RepID=A0A3N0BZU2_9SPHI|nr:glycosyltransferase family A protein [Pedobacter jejuensis]RNL55413.1 glycosyltransferase family 2 protein [Pedobacter jejuensis]